MLFCSQKPSPTCKVRSSPINMASASLGLHFPTLTSVIRVDKSSHSEFLRTPYFQRKVNDHHHGLTMCKATSSSTTGTSLVSEYDLYDLLGIDSSSDERQIKMAYRSLQKRCHPDIAGPAGHDMAIILNEAYALLSDPVARSLYDKEQAKTTELRGYTGQPMYSVWKGAEAEERAVFVDEAKCVGCLKCALLAEKTFAIESAYGRARVVSQWADPEDKIQASIDACPVNCISVVERSDLAALEFLMSKQPRGKVRIGASNTAGARSFDVFSELKVFYKRLEAATTKKSDRDSQYSKLQTDERLSAIQAIRAISNWLYWQSPASGNSLSLTLKVVKRPLGPDVEKLREAAAAIRGHTISQKRKSRRHLPQTTSNDEYWTPSTPLQVKTKNTPTTLQTPSTNDGTGVYTKTHVKQASKQRRPYIPVIPIGLAVLAAINIKLHGAGGAVGGLEEHIGGSFALQVVNSSWLQVILAGVPWYLIGVAVERLVEGLSSRDRM